MAFFRFLKKYLSVIVAALCSAASVVFTVVCMSLFKEGFLFEYSVAITSAAVCLEIVYITILFLLFFLKKNTAFKIMLTGIVLIALALLVLFSLQASGLWYKIDNVEDLREMIASTGAWAPVVFVLLQVFQVCLLPIPGVLTVGAGVLAFGEWRASFYSYIGILIGSFIAFGIGRVVGYKAAAWLVGKETLDSWLEKLKGKSNVILTVMFVLPMFPDDVLCFVAGLSAMSWKYFIGMQLVARAISVLTTCFSVGGSIIPYTTWWGILIWICIGLAILALFIVLYKKGDAIEKWFLNLFSKKNKTNSDLIENAESDERGENNDLYKIDGVSRTNDDTVDLNFCENDRPVDQNDCTESETEINTKKE